MASLWYVGDSRLRSGRPRSCPTMRRHGSQNFRWILALYLPIYIEIYLLLCLLFSWLILLQLQLWSRLLFSLMSTWMEHFLIFETQSGSDMSSTVGDSSGGEITGTSYWLRLSGDTSTAESLRRGCRNREKSPNRRLCPKILDDIWLWSPPHMEVYLALNRGLNHLQSI